MKRNLQFAGGCRLKAVGDAASHSVMISLTGPSPVRLRGLAFVSIAQHHVASKLSIVLDHGCAATCGHRQSLRRPASMAGHQASILLQRMNCLRFFHGAQVVTELHRSSRCLLAVQRTEYQAHPVPGYVAALLICGASNGLHTAVKQQHGSRVCCPLTGSAACLRISDRQEWFAV